MEKDNDVDRPEELINSYVRLVTATINITSGVGTLALLWSTVVLLGGFVSILEIKEFWILTALSFLMASRMMENYDNEFKRGIYTEETKIFAFVWLQKWIPRGVAWLQSSVLGMVLLPKLILLTCLRLFGYIPLVSLGISVWRLVRRDYGNNAGGDVANAAKLNGALDIFYTLVLFQGLLSIYWMTISWWLLGLAYFDVAQVTSKQCGHEKWSSKLVDMYSLETRRKFRKDGELPDSWNLITYGLELLQSASGHDDHRWGARVLDKLIDEDKTVRQELLSSRLPIQNLIAMIGRRGAADDGVENRERATRIIVAHLATDLHITHFPGILQCICSLIQSSCEQQVNSPWTNPDDEQRQTHADENYHIVAPTTTDQTDEEQAVTSSPSVGLANGQITIFLQSFLEYFLRPLKFTKEVVEYSEAKYRRLYKSMGAKELISQGYLILERLTQDEGNCTEICKDQRLLSKITAPLRSHDILSKLRDNTTIQMLNKTLTVLSRLLTSLGEGAARLRHELASNTEAVSNLMGILENDIQGAHKLHERAQEILTELAFDDSFKEQDFDKLFKALLRIFLEKEANNTTVQQPNNATAQVEQADDTEKATRLRGRAAEALARLLPLGTARCTLSNQIAINVLTTVLNEISSSKMGTTAIGPDGSNSGTLEITIVESQPLEEADTNGVQPPAQENEKKFEATKFMSAMLSLAVVIHNEDVISKEDFANYATPEDDEALAKKLKEILEVNKNNTAECLRIVKLICQVVIAMIKVKSSCIQNFSGHNLKEALAVALETMSEVDDCMLFAGNDREVIKPARCLASLVKEAQELLQTE